MMQRTTTGLAIALALAAACASKASGPTLWKQACEHIVKLSASAEPTGEVSVEECVAGYRSYPAAVSDDMARCVLQRDSLPSIDDLQDCLGEESKAFVRQTQQTDAAVSRHEAAVQAYEQEHGALPDRLSDLGADYDGKDAWGRPLVYERTTETEFSLCSAGYDGQSGNEDDQCRAFIYFQF